MANANASPVTADASTGSLAPPMRIYYFTVEELAERLNLDPVELFEGFILGGDDIVKGIALAALAEGFDGALEEEPERPDCVLNIWAQDERVEIGSHLRDNPPSVGSSFKARYYLEPEAS